MNALKLAASRRRKQVVILHCLLSKPTKSVTSPTRSISVKRMLRVAAVLAAVVALAIAAGLAAADVMAGKIALAMAALPVCYFCLKGGAK